MVVAGDMSQIDLPVGVRSGLVEATQILDGIEGIGIAEFTSEDVVRHPLVTKIVKAYDKEVQRRKGLN
jgi:phosphate starvation-inducible PhoH-like protein